MRQLTTVLFSVLLFNAFSQNGKVISAWKYLNDYNQSKDVASLNQAKEAIDLAVVHEDTKGLAKTWKYKGDVYLTLFNHNLKSETDKVVDPNKKVLIAYQNISPSELEQANEAFAKANVLDVKKDYNIDIAKYQEEIAKHFENMGIAHFNAKSFAASLPMFEKAVEVNSLLGRVDSVNINNSAIVAERSGNHEKTKMHYQKLIDLKYGKASSYSSLASACLALNDTSAAVEVLQKGREAYPGDVNLIITETNLALRRGENEKVINNLKLAIEKMPNDPNLFLVLGNVYDNLANPKDSIGGDAEKPVNYEELLKKAEENYKKAIEIKADYFDALYNLGVLYNNHGVAIAKKADSIMDQAKYATFNALANEEFNRAIPVLEKALEFNPSDKGTLHALKQLYTRTQQMEKLNRVNEKLKN